MMRRCTLFFCFLLTCGAVMADELGAQSDINEKKYIWINAAMLSHHFDRNKSFRENNRGFDAEGAFPDTNEVTRGFSKIVKMTTPTIWAGDGNPGRSDQPDP